MGLFSFLKAVPEDGLRMNEVIQTSLFTDWEDHHEKGWFDDALDTLEVNEHNGWPDRFGDALHSWTSKNQKSTITAISLFSGGGGLDIGFHDAGFQIVECNELEPAFAATLQKNTAKGLRLEVPKSFAKILVTILRL